MKACGNICIFSVFPKMAKAFSLVEIVAVLTIAALIMLAAINMYSSVRTAAAKINQRLDEGSLATEILQRIAEDLDRLAGPGLDTKITINNKFDSGYNISRMIIENRFANKRDRFEDFEKITWQTYFDPFEDSLVIYRSHSGLNLEDKVIDRNRPEEETAAEIFIPLTSGITFFDIKVPKDEDFVDRWSSDKLPLAITVTISFAEPMETIAGQYEVAEDEKVTRTIAIDRTRKISYLFVERDLEQEYFDDDESEVADPNQIKTGNRRKDRQ